jgi:prepilin-type N-terminal cleavage/methylation domain-containing protein
MKSRGFTLVEMIVVVSIIAILSGVGLFQYNEASKKSRDYDRQSDLKNVQAALDLYKQKYGRYPARCTPKNGTAWSGQLGTNYECQDGSGQYITGLAPEFIAALPQDKKLNGSDSGYVYTVNAEGTVYKFEAKKTVESETIQTGHKLASCDVYDFNHADGGMCVRVASQGNNTPDWCQDYNGTFQTSYAVWGGFANSSSATFVERYTEDVVCAVQ